jgi:hypothetical protein
MSDLIDRIWICPHVGEYGHYYPEAVEAEGEYGGAAVAYAPQSALEAKDAEIARLREALRQIIPMTDEIASAPITAERWAERIEDIAQAALAEGRKSK